MIEVKVTSNADREARKIRALQRTYRLDLLQGIAGHIDDVRKYAADKMMIARNVPLSTPYRMQKKQKVDSKRLTERTGLYKRVYREGNFTFSGQGRSAKLENNMAFRTNIKGRDIGKSSEDYKATMWIDHKTDAIAARIRHETTGARSTHTVRKMLQPALETLHPSMGPRIGRALRSVFNRTI